MKFLVVSVILFLTVSCISNTSMSDNVASIKGKWTQVDASRREENLLQLKVTDDSAVFTMKSLPGDSKTYTYKKVLDSSNGRLVVKCSVPDVTIYLTKENEFLYFEERFPSAPLAPTFKEVYKRY